MTPPPRLKVLFEDYLGEFEAVCARPAGPPRPHPLAAARSRRCAGRAERHGAWCARCG